MNMDKKNKPSIVFIGAGNVASHLAKAFHQKGFIIAQVIGRTTKSAELLAKQLGCPFSNQLDSIQHDAGLYIISVPDDHVPDVLEQVDFTGKKVVHTAGSIPLSVFGSLMADSGVLYPLQTFTKDAPLDVSVVPFCLEASSGKFFRELEGWVLEIANFVRNVNSEQRKWLHLAAVFACNFSNFMYDISSQLLEDNGLDFDFLRPLVQETSQKVMDKKPLIVQTGPAKRQDEQTMKKHVQLLEKYPGWDSIYKEISKNIVSRHNRHD